MESLSMAKASQPLYVVFVFIVVVVLEQLAGGGPTDNVEYPTQLH